MQTVIHHALMQNAGIQCIDAVHAACHEREATTSGMTELSSPQLLASCQPFHSVCLCCSRTCSPALPSLAADSCLRNALSARSWACKKLKYLGKALYTPVATAALANVLCWSSNAVINPQLVHPKEIGHMHV